MNLLDNITNQPSKFRTTNSVEINDDPRGTYNTNSQIKFKTSMPKLSSCDYSDAYIHVKEVPNTSAATAAANNIGKTVILKNCAPVTDCISEINNTK